MGVLCSGGYLVEVVPPDGGPVLWGISGGGGTP